MRFSYRPHTEVDIDGTVETIEDEYDVLVRGEVIGTVARHEGETDRNYGPGPATWHAGGHSFPTRRAAAEYRLLLHEWKASK